jgi:hypothetical protein
MTRKDYVLIAEALASVRNEYADAPMRNTHTDCCEAVADALARDNARFDRARFLKACGVES